MYKHPIQTLTAAALLATAQATLAAPAETKNVDASAKWMVHLDVDALMKSTVAKHALESNPQLSGQKLQALQTLTGINIKEGLHGVTVFGNGDPENGVIIIHAEAKQDNLVSFAQLNDGYKAKNYKGQTIHSFPDKNKPGKRVSACFLPGSKIILAPQPGLVELGIDLLKGNRPAMDANSETNALAEFQDTPVLLAYGDFAALQKEKDKKKAAAFQHAKRLGLSLGESEGKVRGMLGVITESAETALQVENFFRGIIAMGQLSRENNPALASLADAVQVKRKESSVVGIEVEIPTQSLIEIGETLKKNKQKAKAAQEEGGIQQ